MQMQATGTDRGDKWTAVLIAAGGAVIAAAALAASWIALPSLFTEHQLGSAGILAGFVLFATWALSATLPRTLARLGLPMSLYACREAATLMLVLAIVGMAAGAIFANTSVGVLILFACLGPRVYLKNLRPTPATARR
jgi:hypothetical protein